MLDDTRARITVPDVLFVTATIFLMAVLGPVFMTSLEDNLGRMNQGTVMLLRLILPLLVLVFFSTIYRKAVGGAS